MPTSPESEKGFYHKHSLTSAFNDGFSSSNGSASSESCGNHKIKFTKKDGCTPTTWICVILALLFVTVGAAVAIYYGLHYLNKEKHSERVFKGTFSVTDGDKFTERLKDSLSDEFQTKVQLYKSKLEMLFNSSVYSSGFVRAEIIALESGRQSDDLVVHFNVYLSTENFQGDSGDLYVILMEEFSSLKYGVFNGIKIDQNSVQVQERTASETEIYDSWIPRQQYPGYLEGLTTDIVPVTSPLPTILPRRCGPIALEFCKTLSYNVTSYPNLVGHSNTNELKEDLITYRQIVDFECYTLAQEFVCQILQPQCQNDDVILPCRNFCEDFWSSCKKLLPKKVHDKINCSTYPKYKGPGSCNPKPDYCDEGQFFCGNKQCVQQSKRCDTSPDCFNGADERNCLAVAPSISDLKKTPQLRYHEGYLIYIERGKFGKICTDSWKNTTSAPQINMILQTLAISTCNMLNYQTADHVEIRKDVEEDGLYVESKEPLLSTVKFSETPCESRHVVYMKCGNLECGINTPSKNSLQPAQLQKVTHGNWPWYVVMIQNGEHVCDGTLVDREWIITSTVCFSKYPRTNWTIRLGSVRLGSSSPYDQERRIVGVLKSPFGARGVTLIKLNTPVTMTDYTAPVCLPQPNMTILPGDNCFTLGWDTKGDQLQQIMVRISFPESCTTNESFPSHDIENICAEMVGNTSTNICMGKELGGRSLFCQKNTKWYLAGIGSQKETCEEYAVSRVFQRITTHSQWITYTIESLRPT
ncbi:atrial natriuretic peptide-converting enzyme-like isoform X2 [Tachypleus tridentatus]|uniref:atrial natriuretic peptide-converting enzyme-like isoform X2 n=1 Tax=Tachypleus tridentatus TaxID=6853 RepID=UPI003FCF1F41